MLVLGPEQTTHTVLWGSVLLSLKYEVDECHYKRASSEEHCNDPEKEALYLCVVGGIGRASRGPRNRIVALMEDGWHCL
jgi:hypothetical protein